MIANSFVLSRSKQWKQELWGDSNVLSELNTNTNLKKVMMKTIRMKDLSELKKSLPCADYDDDTNAVIQLKDECKGAKIRTKQATSKINTSNDIWDNILINQNCSNYIAKVPNSVKKSLEKGSKLEDILHVTDEVEENFHESHLESGFEDPCNINDIRAPKVPIRDITHKSNVKERPMKQSRDKQK